MKNHNCNALLASLLLLKKGEWNRAATIAIILEVTILIEMNSSKLVSPSVPTMHPMT
jgi:hypothetical protein